MILPKIIEVKQESPDNIHITWIVNNICPNSCSYCPAELHNGSNHNYDWDNARRFVELLFKKYKNIQFSIGGGEPSMSPFFPELVKMIYSNGHSVSITSNAYKSQDYWIDIGQYINSISFSYHPEFSTEQYFKNVEAAANVSMVTARVMMLSNQWDKCIAAYERLSLNKLHTTEMVRIYDWGTNSGTEIYTDEQLQRFNSRTRTSGFNPKVPNKTVSKIGAKYLFDDGSIGNNGLNVQYVNRGQTNFMGYECDIGLRSLFISSLGEIKRGNCMAGGTIGHINDPENIQWPTESIICPFNICGCVSDVSISKRLKV